MKKKRILLLLLILVLLMAIVYFLLNSFGCKKEMNVLNSISTVRPGFNAASLVKSLSFDFPNCSLSLYKTENNSVRIKIRENISEEDLGIFYVRATCNGKVEEYKYALIYAHMFNITKEKRACGDYDYLVNIE